MTILLDQAILHFVGTFAMVRISSHTRVAPPLL
jgi:hypothetical protein